MHDNEKELIDVIYNSPWRNVYWFARNLLNTDRFGAIGKNEKLMKSILSETNAILLQNISEIDRFNICMGIIAEKIKNSSKASTKTITLKENFLDYIKSEIKTSMDLMVFLVTIEFIVIPANRVVSNIPSDDVSYCRTVAENILNSMGRSRVDIILSTWDDMGVNGCLNAERLEIVKEFTRLRANLETLEYDRTEIENNAVLTAFVQELERRIGQKRKNRAGGSLEDVTTFLFNFYNFKSHEKPDHFQTDIEVDKWFKCKDGWSIGISCKRTLRERWKQVSSADSNALSRYKIKEIWHILTYDKDLSDEKITMLGQQRQVFYLVDSSLRYQSAKKHIGMKDYVRPLSSLIDDIAREQGTEAMKP